ncbi:MAG: phosphate ABC transporter permease subunit PstC, partial [Planctomycetota bacterium]
MMADEGNSQPAAQPFAEKLRSTTRSLFWIRFRERFIFAGLSLSAIFSVLVTIAIILVLVTESINFFRFPEISLIDFLFYPEWTAGLGEEIHYGILPLISGTMLVTVIAMLIAIPL